MNTISVDYALVWQLDFADNYQFTKCGKCFNIETGRQLKKAYQGGSIGYYIKGKFMTIERLRHHLSRIEDYPF